MTNYQHYFNIDPDYSPVVNDKLIEEKPDLWKQYYPHKTFIELLNNTVKVLNRRENKSIWVQGAYGSGKSHAVLALKKLLEADDANTKLYFDKYNLDSDLLNKFENIKNSDGKILTVHRYGSASIRNDYNLAVAIQESIENALEQNGLNNSSKGVLRKDIIKWLEDEKNKDYFNNIIKESAYFAGDNADSIIEKLQKDSDKEWMPLMNNIFRVAEDRGITAFKLEISTLVEWIKSIIKENKLKAIVFIWDEFTEYFKNNAYSLTGFQELAELSITEPFYFVIVTHLAQGLFSDTNIDAKKLKDRFIDPPCIIELPENTAFDLLGHAMKKNEDESTEIEWKSIVDDLYYRTHDARDVVEKSAKINETQLKNILPIHPYTALILKHISSAFGSNQRSMFEFIGKPSENDNKSFRWFIENCGPYDTNPLLTIDLLWDYFYVKGKDSLSTDVRLILDSYTSSITENLRSDQKRIFKVILLMQAISQKVGDSVELFIPNDKNLSLAFIGSDVEGQAVSIAKSLVRQNIIYTKSLGNNKEQYTVLTNVTDFKAIDSKKEELKRKTTIALLNEVNFKEDFSSLLRTPLRLRYSFDMAQDRDFDQIVKKYKNSLNNDNKLNVILTFAKNDNERMQIQQKIKNLKDSEQDQDFVIVDASNTIMGQELYDSYIDNMANAQYQTGKDNDQARIYTQTAQSKLKDWIDNIKNGTFVVYSSAQKESVLVNGLDALNDELARINRFYFPESLESHYVKVIDNMYNANSLASGVECGAKQEVTGTYRSSNKDTKLETALDGAWQIPNYWDEPSNSGLLITKIKKHVDEKINETFKKENKISMSDIYNELTRPPFGFMPCNLTAFIMGFVLKEYVNGKYIWSDNVTNVPLTVDKLKEMVSSVIKYQQTPANRYKESYIVTETEEIRSFNNATSEIFSISKHLCSSVENTREVVRETMKNLIFPIYYLKSILSVNNLSSSNTLVEQLIDSYCALSNNDSQNKSDNDIAKDIGILCKNNPTVISDLKSLLTPEKCKEAMDNFLKTYNNGELIKLSETIGDKKQYINVLKSKFESSEEANWLWKEETSKEIINETILEYKIINETNKILTKNYEFNDTIQAWCNACSHINISYELLKNENELENIINALYHLKKKNTLINYAEKEEFLKVIISDGNIFKNLYNNKVDTFRNVCRNNLQDLSDEDIRKIYNKLPQEMFILDKVEYIQKVSEEVNEYKNTQEIQQLRNLWQDKTGTKTPIEWSEKNKLPILYMVDAQEYQIAKLAFDTINSNQPNSDDIKRSLDYLSKATFYEDLKNQKKKDAAFAENILKKYSIIIDNIDSVKQILIDSINGNIYDWVFQSMQIEDIIEHMAQDCYSTNGYQTAISAIESMDSADVKKYLSELIKDNMNVGIEIIKTNKRK